MEEWNNSLALQGCYGKLSSPGNAILRTLGQKSTNKTKAAESHNATKSRTLHMLMPLKMLCLYLNFCSNYCACLSESPNVTILRPRGASLLYQLNLLHRKWVFVKEERRDQKRWTHAILPDPAPVCDCCCCWAARLDVTCGGCRGAGTQKK